MIAFAEEAERLGLEWADADAVLSQFEDLKKVVLSDALPKDSALNPKRTQGEREAEALRSEEYKNHLRALYEAKRRSNAAKVRYSAAQAKLDAIRTILSNKRAMFQRGLEA